MATSRVLTIARRLRRPLIVAPLLILLLAIATHALWLGALGDFLVLAEPPTQADAIVVLAGHSPARAQHAVRLYQAGYAPRLIVSDEQVWTHGLTTTWNALHRAGVAALPVPDSALTVLPISFSTYDEALLSRDALVGAGLRSAIIVTDAFHSRRASMVFDHVYRPAGLRVHLSPAGDPSTALKQWWLDEDKSLDVLSEYGKLAYYAVRGWLF